MIICVISDVHANLEAFQAVSEAFERFTPESVVCLGDLVGYNADPDACVSLVMSRVSAVVRGNHDKAVSGQISLDWFNPVAREAARWTRMNSRRDTLDAVAALPQGPREAAEGVLICHGTPMDEDRYIIEKGSIDESFAFLARNHPGARVCFFGHTHVPMIARRERGGRKTEMLPAGDQVDLEEGWTYLVNPGSVGQPRDGNPGATFGILDTEKRSYRMFRVSYDAAVTRRKIVAAGLPRELALRLQGGW